MTDANDTYKLLIIVYGQRGCTSTIAEFKNHSERESAVTTCKSFSNGNRYTSIDTIKLN